jgi:hypothetical protein
MKIKVNWFAAGCLTFCLFYHGSLSAQSRPDTLNKLSPGERVLGFQLLFNGTDLAGWRAIASDRPPVKGWVVENGVLHILPSQEGSPDRGGDIVTVQRFAFFELTFDFKITEGANLRARPRRAWAWNTRSWTTSIIPMPGSGRMAIGPRVVYMT